MAISAFRISVERARYLVAIVAGLLLALSFPRASIAGLAWIAPGLLLFAALGAPTPKAIFRVGFTGGFTYYLASLYWLLHIPVPFLPIVGWVGLSAYLALFTGLWAWLCSRFAPGQGKILESSWLTRTVWSLQCAAFWVATEIVIGRFLSGFPWDFLGVSQYRLVPLIQIAEFTGVYGVSFLIIWFSVSLFVTAWTLWQAPSVRSRWSREIALPLLTLLGLVTIGFYQARALARPAPQVPTVQLALIQPSIPQTLIWDEKENENRFQQLLKLSEQALASKPDILVWPEASAPNMLRHDRDTADAVRDLARRYKVWVILGSDDAEQRPGTAGLREIDYFNSAFAISPEGELKGMYRKRRLVIFGEYMPFVKLLPFLRKLSPAGESGFTPGDRPIPFTLDSLGITASILICFEDTFPHVAREYVTSNTDFLMNLTNNGWFGESAAQWQHAATAVFRAVENRTPLVRCTNNGLTCWVDQAGVVRDIFSSDTGNVYRTGFKIVTVPVLTPGTPRALTFYTRYGDVFGWACFALTAVRLGEHSGQRRRSRRETSRQKSDPLPAAQVDPS